MSSPAPVLPSPGPAFYSQHSHLQVQGSRPKASDHGRTQVSQLSVQKLFSQTDTSILSQPRLLGSVRRVTSGLAWPLRKIPAGQPPTQALYLHPQHPGIPLENSQTACLSGGLERGSAPKQHQEAPKGQALKEPLSSEVGQRPYHGSRCIPTKSQSHKGSFPK